jgi:hypothetical protein
MSTAKSEKQRQECLLFAAAIIDTWQPSDGSSWNNDEGVDRDTFLLRIPVKSATQSAANRPPGPGQIGHP